MQHMSTIFIVILKLESTLLEFLNIVFFVKVKQVWNDMRERKWWTFHFGWTIPLSPRFSRWMWMWWKRFLCLWCVGFVRCFHVCGWRGGQRQFLWGSVSRCAVKSSAAKVTQVCLSVSPGQCLSAVTSSSSFVWQWPSEHLHMTPTHI